MEIEYSHYYKSYINVFLYDSIYRCDVDTRTFEAILWKFNTVFVLVDLIHSCIIINL
jgi:hypothetical protein